MAIVFRLSEQPSSGFGQLFRRCDQIYSGYYHFSQSDAWQPPINIYEDHEHYYICAELGGLDKAEVAVEVVDKEIRIQGERPVPIPCDPQSTECILRIEIDSGRFFRAVELPDKANLSTTAARLDRGFLWITVGKKQES